MNTLNLSRLCLGHCFQYQSKHPARGRRTPLHLIYNTCNSYYRVEYYRVEGDLCFRVPLDSKGKQENAGQMEAPCQHCWHYIIAAVILSMVSKLCLNNG